MLEIHYSGREPAIYDRFFFFVLIIEEVTFPLHGWCMMGVFMEPAFIRLGHELQDLLSPCDGMHVSTDQTSVYTLI